MLSLEWLLLVLVFFLASSSSYSSSLFGGGGGSIAFADAFQHTRARILPYDRSRRRNISSNLMNCCFGLDDRRGGTSGFVVGSVESCSTTGMGSSIIMPCSTKLYAKSNADDEEDPIEERSASSSSVVTILDTLGLVSQPIVWISLYCVATTGAGLPAGPFGLLGGIEGVSYLFVVGYVLASLVGGGKEGGGPSLKLVESLSWLSLGAGLFTLCVLVAKQGCIPNAKPILDYSEYLPVCEPDQTPGFFGG